MSNIAPAPLRRFLCAVSIVLIGLVFILQGLGMISFPEKKAQIQPVRAGGIRCDEPVWNFGEIDPVKNPRLSHEFVLVNESKETVTIQKVLSTCGCMVAEGYDKEIEPSRSTKLQVHVLLPPTPGAFHKNLSVEIEGHGSALPLDVMGEALPNSSLYSVPAQVDFGTIRPGETKERTVQILRYDLSPILFEGTVGNEKHFEYQCEPLESRDDLKILLRIRLTAKEETAAGRYQQAFTIKTKNSENPECQLPVSVLVRETTEE